MSMSTAILEEQIIRYYDNCHRDFQTAWHLNSHLSMHYGYWTGETANSREALINLDRKVAETVAIKPTDLVLDAGCGVGGSAIFLAKNYHCRIEGITLSQKQVDFARAKTFQNQLQDRISFSVVNFTNTPFQDETFDVVWAIESVCHTSEKQAFLNEAFRILKPKGRLIIADFFGNHDSSKDGQQWMQKWARAKAIPKFETFPDFITKVKDSGFRKINTRNITKNIAPSARRLYYLHVPGLIYSRIYKIFGRSVESIALHSKASLYQYRALKENLWNYHLLYAVKKNKKEQVN